MKLSGVDESFVLRSEEDTLPLWIIVRRESGLLVLVVNRIRGF